MTSQTLHSAALPSWFSALLRVGKKSWWLTLVLWLAAIAPSLAAELELRVAIEENVAQVAVGSSGAAALKDASGRVVAAIPASGGFLNATSTGGGLTLDQWQSTQFWIEPAEGSYVYINGKFYRGRTQVVPTDGGVTAVNYVDLEHYLYSVVGGEVPSSWPIESLKAQAVAARSYVLYQRQTSANRVFDVGDTQRWQVYNGIEKESANTISAVEATRGQVLTYSGQIIEAVFHSSSGGHTENVEDVWSSPRAYLRAVQDYDQGAPVYEWSADFTADALSRRITGVGNILQFVPERTTPQGRVITMRVVGDAGSRVLSGAEIRDALGLKSTLFRAVPGASRVAAANGAPLSGGFTFTGRGFGHGLGMSQWGAHNLAERGYTYQQIVTHYYTGASLAAIRVE